jgi:hypothetical protein
MSYERGMAAINLECPPEIPRTEYLDHPAYMKFLTGLDLNNPAEAEECQRQTYAKLDYDFWWYVANHSTENGRSTWMGTSTYSENQADVRGHVDGFQSVREVLDVDPIAEWGLPDPQAQAEVHRKELAAARSILPNAVVPGGVYNSVFTWAIIAFGWEMFMQAAMDDPVRFDEILEGFLTLSLRDVEAWCANDIPCFLCHDDIMWSSGPVFHPDWYRKHIFPRYERLWAPIKAKGLKVLFCSDGDFTTMVDDLAAVGADGFIFEPLVDLEQVAAKYGQTHVLIGNMDCRELMRSKANIEAEVERCYAIGRNCPGYFFAVGNHIPYNVPLENVDYYMKLIESHRKR